MILSKVAKAMPISIQKYRAIRIADTAHLCLEPGQLVLVGDAEDLAKRGVYRVGKIHAVHPQICREKIVRRVTIAALKNTGSNKIWFKRCCQNNI